MTDNEVLFVRSSKKNGNKSTEGDSSTNEDDIWDDTLLIKAYDKAVKLAQQSCLKKNDGEVNSKVKKKGEQKWKVGDKCRCQYSEDLKYYEADIVDILGSSGMCVVKYVGYENEEKVPLKKLKPSSGESARTRQCKEALDEDEQDTSMEGENNLANNSIKNYMKLENQRKTFGGKKKADFISRNGVNEPNSFGSMNFPPPQIGNPIIPPPPPPHIFNKFNEDENETEAMSAMLISWYMSGYHTGYYQGLKMGKRQ